MTAAAVSACTVLPISTGSRVWPVPGRTLPVARGLRPAGLAAAVDIGTAQPHAPAAWHPVGRGHTGKVSPVNWYDSL